MSAWAALALLGCLWLGFAAGRASMRFERAGEAGRDYAALMGWVRGRYRKERDGRSADRYAPGQYDDRATAQNKG